jgi:histidyl-tRNA synthetase
MERLSLLLEDAGLTPPTPRSIAVIPVGDASEGEAITLMQELRGLGVPCEIAYRGNTKRRMERANKSSAPAALILGESELADGMVVVRDLVAGTQERVARDAVLQALANTSASEVVMDAVLDSQIEAMLDEDQQDQA